MDNILINIQNISLKIDKIIKDINLSYSESKNSSGENQLKIDINSDKIVEKELSTIPNIKALISEEKDEMLVLDNSAKYIICYDPLDGSSLVDVNLSIGTIFGIYEDEAKGENLIASAYIVYGPRVEIVYVKKNSKPTLYRYLNNSFVEVRKITLKDRGNINSTGGTQKYWSQNHKYFNNYLFQQGYSLRYSGGLVPDLHQILLKGGGIFSYPPTSKRAYGKLRQLFEVIPFALIFKEAGGDAIDSNGNSLLNLSPKNIHDRSSCFFGSKYEISKLKEYL